MKELEKGKTLEGEYGHYVNLDIRHLGEKKINSKLPFVRELCLKYENIDPVKEMIPVRPVVHYMMGGIHTDINGATPLEGLYAAGETACVSINGANRLGSNSLTELLVFGARAGKVAVENAKQQPEPKIDLLQYAVAERKRINDQYLTNIKGDEKLSVIRKEMHKTMEEGAGIYRNEDSLKKSLKVIMELKKRFKNVSIDDHSLAFNTELIAAIELSNMLEIADTIIQSALNRKESRGSHQRTDYEQRDDKNYLTHSLAYETGEGSPKIEYLPVTITKWPPGERVYGK